MGRIVRLGVVKPSALEIYERGVDLQVHKQKRYKMKLAIILSFIVLIVLMWYRSFIIKAFDCTGDFLIYISFLSTWKIILRKK